MNWIWKSSGQGPCLFVTSSLGSNILPQDCYAYHLIFRQAKHISNSSTVISI